MLIATSGDESYVIFNYKDLTWHADSNNGGNERGMIEDPNSDRFPKVGFNMGKGRLFMALPFSGDNDVVSLSESVASIVPSGWNQTNEDSIKGIFVYRISGPAELLVGSCHVGQYRSSSDHYKRLMIDPPTGFFLGGQKVSIRGHCFDTYTHYKIVFETEPDQITVDCEYYDKLTITCMIKDWFLRRGYIPFRLYENHQSTALAGYFYASTFFFPVSTNFSLISFQL